ncbi:GNAT family N-acetyltransferase [Geodermatophilus sp. SYSU D00696]
MPSSRQELIPLENRNAWEETLAGIPHAFAHTWASCRAMYFTTGWPTYLWTWARGTSRAVCAISERGDGGTVDVVTPYGFGGVVGVGLDFDVLDDWSVFARDRGYVCGYLGLNPELTPSVVRRSGEYTEHNDVYVLDLDRGVEALHTALSTNRRRQLRAFADGPARVIDDRERLTRWFLDNVGSFLSERGASAVYAFSALTWESLLGLDNVLVLGVEEPDGAIAAVSVFAHTPHCAEYLFGISRPEGRSYSAVLIWSAVEALSEMGIPRLNLGGGVRRGDGIADFKERFGARRLPLGALKEVYRPEAYAALCRAAGKDPADRAGFFPAYRAPDALATDQPADRTLTP